MKKIEKKEFEKPRRCVSGKRFYNYTKETRLGFLSRSIVMIIKSWWIRRKTNTLNNIDSWFCKSEPVACSIHPKITWIGHASFLIQIGGVNILTDPVLREPSALFPRYLPLGVSVDKMPNIDFVLLSHNHPDHMDTSSLLKLKEHNGTHFLVPQGDKLWFDQKSFARTREYTWWQKDAFSLSYDSSKTITFTFLPANHWSLRTLFGQRNKSLWGGWMIECNGHTIYFAGDTSYDSHFKEISHKFKNIDVALMPIGPCEPKHWVGSSHVDAVEAGQAFLDLQAKHFIPMHWGTFPMGTELYDTPIVRLKKWWKENTALLEDKKLCMIKVGQPFEFASQAKSKMQNQQHQADMPSINIVSETKKPSKILEK